MAAEVRMMKTPAELALAETFAAARGTLPGDGDIAARRADAFARFAAAGLPHRRIEAWHYTDLRALMREALPVAGAPDAAGLEKAKVAGAMLAEVDARRLYLVNGTFAPEISDLADLEPGLSITGLAAALGAGDPLVTAHLGRTVAADDAILALNTALMGDGVVIHVAAGVELARPLLLVSITTQETPSAVFSRSLMVVEEGASARLVEIHEGPGGDVAYQVNTALELVVGPRANLDRVKIACEGAGVLHVGSVLAKVADHAKVALSAFNLSGGMVRNQLMMQITGAYTEAHISGVSLLNARQQADTMLALDHIAPHCESRENFRAVLDGSSRDVFQGRIAVRREAQKTDARMLARALLLSENAESDNKPELEIFADDVQCGHGCTTGTLDEQLRFYLMSRGIPAREAEALLIQAFVGEVTDAVADDGVREALIEATRNWLLTRE